jgi:hypothetical protein
MIKKIRHTATKLSSASQAPKKKAEDGGKLVIPTDVAGPG